MPHSIQQLLPDCREVGLESVYSDLGLTELKTQARPYTVINMIATVDGKSAVKGKSGAIGGQVDRELFMQLRTQADAVMVGAGTMRAENYGRLLRDPKRREQRQRLGLDPDPLVVIVSSRLNIPQELPLLGSSESRVAVFTNSEKEIGAVEADLSIEREPGDSVDLARALTLLRGKFDVKALLVEGGPALAGSLLAQGLADEIFLTISPKLAGSSELLTLFTGMQLPELVDLELITLFSHCGYLFLRYRVPT